MTLATQVRWRILRGMAGNGMGALGQRLDGHGLSGVSGSARNGANYQPLTGIGHLMKNGSGACQSGGTNS